MPYNANERLEREARESLVASDLSAKMKQWRDQTPPPKGGGSGGAPLRILLLLLALGGAAWLFWPKMGQKTEAPPKQPSTLPANEQKPAQDAILPKQTPIAQKPDSSPSRYLALAQSNYISPDFSAEIRGNASNSQDLLNEARRVLSERRFTDALHILQSAPAEYETDAAYLRAHALFGLKKYPQAATVFGHLTGSIRYGESAQWYEVLSLLPDFEAHKSLVLKKLNRIKADEGHTFHNEAAALFRLL